MAIPDISLLNINGSTPESISEPPDAEVMDTDDRSLYKLKAYTKSLPYATESYSKMMEMLDFIILRIVQCVAAKDYDVGLLQWDSMLT